MIFRTLYDGEQDLESLKAGKDYDPAEDMTRGELLPETDLKQLLARYAPFELPAREAFYGEVDLSLDRHEAVLSLRDAVDRAAEAANRAPEPSSRSGDGSGAPPSDSAAGAPTGASGGGQTPAAQ